MFSFFAGVIYTADKHSFANISTNFRKIRNGPYGILRVPGDTDLWKKSDVENLMSDSLSLHSVNQGQCIGFTSLTMGKIVAYCCNVPSCKELHILFPCNTVQVHVQETIIDTVSALPIHQGRLHQSPPLRSCVFRIAEHDRASHPHTEFCQVRLLDQYQKTMYSENNLLSNGKKRWNLR